MLAWPRLEIPRLDVHGPAVSVYDTENRSLVTLPPNDAARMYVCGITPYDSTHLGMRQPTSALTSSTAPFETPGTMSSMFRTSPTSMTRCWNAPTREAFPGVISHNARPSDSDRT